MEDINGRVVVLHGLDMQRAGISRTFNKGNKMCDKDCALLIYASQPKYKLPDEELTPLPDGVEHITSENANPTILQQANKSFIDLLPLPKSKVCHAEHSKIITSSPVKDELEKKEERKKATPQDVRKGKRNVVSDQKREKKYCDNRNM
ncbi:hypothetical protein QE152_g8081 [Popillia japonica]|uniref:Uncharacterized protein n=1 Tax=Popillia japonica TaxID=7064 RepID=A0AAW1MDD1_POPJA